MPRGRPKKENARTETVSVKMDTGTMFSLRADANRRGVGICQTAYEIIQDHFKLLEVPLTKGIFAETGIVRIPALTQEPQTKSDKLAIARSALASAIGISHEEPEAQPLSVHLTVCGLTAEGTKRAPGCYNEIKDRARW